MFLSFSNDPCFMYWQKTAPSPLIKWKVENTANELDDLAKDTSRQTVEGATWLFSAYTKM